MYLLDTNVISEFRRLTLRRGNKSVQAWAETVSSRSLYLSSITIFEIEVGIHSLEAKDPAGAENIRQWLQNHVLKEFGARILPFDVDEARVCARLTSGRTRPFRDMQIAATALHAGFSLVTRNIKDFEGLPVPLLNPFEVAV
ncbi:type II toxin-antitoxin system VapC family toxin [Rhizobium sp. C4]|uniref:type II toxin-antitoxin system VapC family toxin n=1 Tax=Rhizobium sp. C4 TaxID=1349800 RepID=UPI001E40AE65|nr:type II toxin-antitoxin system VapC family toxin [Rhizobium sp. C4]MCD2174199.1 type II toxin-antitoxin system VapC family toxin [Rhizobium sp. C4]